MPLDEPAWWYGPGGHWQARCLTPAARIYAALSGRRMVQAARYRPQIPVICIGNFTAGGTGKTPLTLAIAQLLEARSLAPAVLTRGYGGRKRGPAWVDTAVDTAREVGDEPLLLAQSVPVMVSPDRVAGAHLIEARTPPATAILMDDGLQNPSLAKDLRIAVVDGRRGVGNGLVIPAGPLRAEFEFQLANTDAIVVNAPPTADAGQATSAIADWLRQRFPGPVLSARPEPRADTAWLAGRPVLAFAGIANPRRFFDLLTGLGAQVMATETFGDHHTYSEAEARRLLAAAAQAGAPLVTTEKDWVRLIGTTGAPAALRETCRPLVIRLAFDARDESRLCALIDGALANRPSSAPGAPARP